MIRPELQDRLSDAEAAEIGRRFMVLMRQRDNHQIAPTHCIRKLIELYDDGREWAGECTVATAGSKPHRSGVPAHA